MTRRETERRLISGEKFFLFNEWYWFMRKPAADGIYHYNITAKKGIRVGCARFTKTAVILAFSFGRFKVSLKSFIHEQQPISSSARTWNPIQSDLPL